MVSVNLPTLCNSEHPTALIVMLHGSGGTGASLEFLARNVIEHMPYASVMLPTAPSLPWMDTDELMPLWYVANTGYPPKAIETSWQTLLDAIWQFQCEHV